MTEEKERSAKLAVKIIIKDLSILVGIFLIMIAIVSIACITSTDSEKQIEAKTIKKADQSQTEGRKKSLPKKYESTMSRMITGKEIAKGDRAIELEKKMAEKKARERKKREKEKQKRRKYFSSSNLELMAHLINGEAGDQSDECQQAVGMVIINRINDSSFKCSTIREAIFSRGQYACVNDGNFDKAPSKQAYKNARAVLLGNTIIDVPKNVVFQSQFKQGSGIWRKIGTEIFCYK